MSDKIKRTLYQGIRNRFYDAARFWNGIKAYIDMNGGSPIDTQKEIPVEVRVEKYIDYSGKDGQINQNISEESNKVHTLGNENNIRDGIKSLNDKVFQYITDSGIRKQNINRKGTKISTDLSTVSLVTDNEYTQSLFDKNGGGIKKYPSNDPTKENHPYPYQTSGTKITTISGINESDVLTYSNNENYKLNKNDVVKYDDYLLLNTVLSKIENCLATRNEIFDGNNRCQTTCQTLCQSTCQLVCQHCNTKQCHNQKCGAH